MKKDNDIVLDQIPINEKFIQFQFQNARNQNKTTQLLSETFKFLDLARIYEINPNDQQNKFAMKNIVNARFIPNHYEDQPRKNALDLTQAHPLNKLGNFGRQLQRKCRLTDKQVMQFQDGKPAKSKQIKSFKNRVQNFSDKRDADNKIGWITDNKNYPFRIVLIDKNAGQKGVYFATQEKAQAVRIFLTQNYMFRGNFLQLAHKGSINHKFAVFQAFKQQIITKNKILRKSNMFSKSIIDVKKSQAQLQQSNSNKNFMNPAKAPDNNSLYYNPNINRSTVNQNMSEHNQFSKNNGLNGSVYGESRVQINQNVPFKQLKQAYTKTFFKAWQEKAKNHPKKPSSSHSKVVYYENKNLYGNDFVQSNVKSVYGNNISQKVSRKHEPFHPFKDKERQSAIDRLGMSNLKEKQSIIKQFNSQADTNEQLICYSIQFLTLKSLFFKPIVTIEMYRQDRLQQSIIYNTLIKKKEPFLFYELLHNEQEESISLNVNLREYVICVKVIDFLANQQVINEKYTMKTKKVLDKTTILSDNKLIKLEMSVKNHQLFQKNNENHNSNNEAQAILNIPDLSSQVREKIRSFWQRQSQSQGYYNQPNLSIYKILSQIESVPLTWWKDVNQDDYEIYQVIHNASKIIGFKMIKAFQHIVKVFYQIYPNLEEMTEKLIAFIIHFLKPYYFPENYVRLQKFHRLIGLEEDCEFISKVNLQIITINKIVEFECPSLSDKLKRRNIVYGYTLMEYVYQFFTRNFTPKCLVEFWNFLNLEMDSLQMHMLLACVSLVKYYEQQLLKAKRLKQFSQILQSLKINKVQFIIKEILALKQKYFGQSKGFIDEIKNIFNSKPLEPVLNDFFKKETSILDKRKSSRAIQKKAVLRKVNKQIQIDIPQYQAKKYCLHIYFHKLPSVSGSLIIRCNNVDYECLNYERNRYFILSQVSDFVHLVFLDLKSNEFTCELVLNQGINEFTTYLISSRNSIQYKITYIAGLLTDSQIDIFKRGKKFDHFVSPFVRKMQFNEEMNRPIQEAFFLRKYDSNNSRDDLIKKIKTLFCTGSKTFDEIDFYLQQIQTSNLTIEEQLSLTKAYARQLSKEFALSRNEIYQKHLIKLFLEKTGYIMDDYEFECYYNDSLQYQFDAPKIIRCRFLMNTPANKELKLQLHAMRYFIEKSAKYVYGDIIIHDFIGYMKEHIIDEIRSNIFQGELRLLYSSHGDIFYKSWLVTIKNKNKEIQYQEIKEDTIDDIQEKQIGEPEVLMTEVLPSFAKISTILDYVNSDKKFDLKNRNYEKEKRKIAQNINIIKDSQAKFSKIIPMRYQIYPSKYHFPFFHYYYDIVKDNYPPAIKAIFLNNLKSDIKSVCVFNGTLKFGDHPKVQSFSYDNQRGLYGNLRLFTKESKGWFFFGDKFQDGLKFKNQAKVFINYGYGVFRWEQCIVLGYTNRVKSSSYHRTDDKNSQSRVKKQYLIRIKSQEKYVHEYELQLRCNKDLIPQILDPNVQKPSNSYFQEHEDNHKQGNLKYLNKFIK